MLGYKLLNNYVHAKYGKILRSFGKESFKWLMIKMSILGRESYILFVTEAQKGYKHKFTML